MSEIDTADRLLRRRARMMPVLAVLFLGQQASYLASLDNEGTRPVDYVRNSGWLLMSTMLLLLLATSGYWFRSAGVRALMNDEGTRANRAEALRIGFVLAMATAIVLYGASLVEPVGGRVAIHLIITVGIGAALVRFGMLERRALKGG